MSSFDLPQADPCLTTVFVSYATTEPTAIQWRVGTTDALEITYKSRKGKSCFMSTPARSILAAADSNWLIDRLSSDSVILPSNTADTLIHSWAMAVTGRKHPRSDRPEDFKRQRMDAPKAPVPAHA